MSRNVSSLPVDAGDLQASRLSAMVDGESSADEQTLLLQQWRSDESTRRDWHLYHLVGDVMRSEDLAQRPSTDLQFLVGLRERLAAEPVVLAPQALTRPERAGWGRNALRRARRWSAPAAVAAGVLSVSGVAVMMRGQVPLGGEPQLLAVASGTAPAASAPSALSAAPGAQAGGGVLVRDPALDRYLELHRQQARTASLAAPDGFRAVMVQPAGQ